MKVIRNFVLFWIVFAAGSAQAAQFTQHASESGAVIIIVQDVIDNGDSQRLEQMLRQASAEHKHVAVYLDSRGGDVDVSMAMGRIIRSYAADTYHGYCASSCVFAFLGGVNRYVSSGSSILNVHRPELAEAYVSNPSPFAKKMLDMLRGYIVEMVGDAGLYDTMMTIPFSNPRALTPNEAISLRVATSIVN